MPSFWTYYYNCHLQTMFCPLKILRVPRIVQNSPNPLLFPMCLSFRVSTLSFSINGYLQSKHVTSCVTLYLVANVFLWEALFAITQSFRINNLLIYTTLKMTNVVIKYNHELQYLTKYKLQYYVPVKYLFNFITKMYILLQVCRILH